MEKRALKPIPAWRAEKGYKKIVVTGDETEVYDIEINGEWIAALTITPSYRRYDIRHPKKNRPIIETPSIGLGIKEGWSLPRKR
ncbi:unnamed protein product [marine sediment metagenome]|uniref:Uncharacterized protein n=1 Tax=marine sediment metagenome TaxID=412755 RepID=X1M5B5_9ZZZZ